MNEVVLDIAIKYTFITQSNILFIIKYIFKYKFDEIFQ